MPELFILIIIASVLPPGFWVLLFIMAIFRWTGFVGVVRAEFLRARNFEYVRAAKALGVSDRTIMFRHMLPNAMVATVTMLPFLVTGAIATLASLDFLGFGLPSSAPSLGELTLQAKRNLQAPWLGFTAFFAFAVMLSLLVFIFEGVRDAFDPRKTRPSVGFDNVAAMKSMADEVIKQGHQRLALISAQTAHNDRAAGRLLGIKNAMDKAGLDPSTLDVIETKYDISDGAEAFGVLMTLPTRPTAVFCGNDVLAVGALRRARALNIAVPEQVSIIGFDDIELSQVTYPALTTVSVPHLEMGRQAAIALVQCVTEGTPITPIELKTELVLRDTLGPVPE